MSCPATDCSICRRKAEAQQKDRTKLGMTTFLVALLAIQAVALALGWIPE